MVVLQRELFREARRKRALMGRVICSVIGFVVCLFLLFANRTVTANGQRVFSLLTLAGFSFCIIQGVRVAAGVIADEKRDGTLGLLLLTPLRPGGVVIGKFFAVGIPMVQPLLAFIPALAITAILGGVTGREILRAVVVIGGALVFSIAAGLCVSAFSRRNEHAGRAALTLMAVFVLLPLIAYGPLEYLRFLSPWTAFTTIGDEHNRISPQDFWAASLALAYCACALIAAAVYFLPRRWETKIEIAKARNLIGRKLSPEERATMLNRSPGEWLAIRESANSMEQIPFYAAIIALSRTAACASGNTGLIALWAATVVLLVRLASQASFPLCNARRSGAVEMLLSTPLEPYSLIAGQEGALKRQFTVPATIVVGGLFFYSIGSKPDPFDGIVQFAFLTILFGAWVASIAALGIFVGLLEKSPASAFFQTVLIGIVAAGLLSLIAGPLPFLLLLGLSGNRLASDQLPQLLKRSTVSFKRTTL